MNENLGPQFYSNEELGELRTGDFPGRVRDKKARARYVAINSEGSELAKHREHGGVSGYLDHLKSQIKQDGEVREPITIADFGDSTRIWDGHTRAIAAYELGLGALGRKVPIDKLTNGNY